jgi:hypothetical protein
MAVGVVGATRAQEDERRAVDALDQAAYETAGARRRAANTLFVAGAAGGAVLAGTAVALLVMGAKRRHKAAQVSAGFGPDGVSLSLSGRF